MNPRWILPIAMMIALPAAAAAGTASTFDSVVGHYETVRLALTGDSWSAETIGTAQRLRQEISALASKPTAEAAAVPAAKLPAVRGLLPEVAEAAAALAAAKDIETARDAFYRLSMPLVRWRASTGHGPAVAFCSMAKRSWLQPAGKQIGNPYYGQRMAKCGQLVG
jgi:hypothetical protein